MGDLILREWRRDELRRIYVNDAVSREPIGFFDRTTGEIVVRYKAREREVLIALKPFLLANAPIAVQRRVDARRPSRVRVEPERTEADRTDADRIEALPAPIQLVEPAPPEPAAAAEPERVPEPVPELVPEPLPDPLPEPAREPVSESVEPLAQPELVPLPPAPEMEVDLSTDIDGATVQEREAEAAQAAAVPQIIQDLAAGLASTLVARMHRTPAPARVSVAIPVAAPAAPATVLPTAPPTALSTVLPTALSMTPPTTPPSRPTGGTRIVDKRLGRLGHDGWKILDSIRLGNGAAVEFLAIGRPGVFTVRAWNLGKARISVEGTAIRVNGTEYPYLDECRAEAETVARRLSSAGTDVRVTPVLALVGVSELDLSRASTGFVVCRGEMVDHVLRDLPGILTNRDQTRVYDLACRPDIWRA
jgi:hypothetical protein